MTPTHVMDACAILAIYNKEVGSNVAAAILGKAANTCVMHSVNICEVWYVARKTETESRVDQLIAELHSNLRVQERSDIDPSFWREVAKYRHVVNSAGKPIALMDCFAIALANLLKAPVVRADHNEFDYVKQNNICPVIFIRNSKTQPLSPTDFAAAVA